MFLNVFVPQDKGDVVALLYPAGSVCVTGVSNSQRAIVGVLVVIRDEFPLRLALDHVFVPQFPLKNEQIMLIVVLKFGLNTHIGL